jgi:hypothetical protein
MELVGKEVEVGTVHVTYRGKLVELNETEVHLETSSGWLVIPVEQVVFIRENS